MILLLPTQAALLYTDVLGRRRLRVHNIAMSATNKYQDLYRSCDIDSVMSFFSKSSKCHIIAV